MPEYVIDPSRPHLGGNIAGGDSWTYDPRLWEWLVSTFSVKTVLDIGCGEGHALDWFASAGCSVVGLEGLPANAEKVKHSVVIHDLANGPCSLAPVDLVWCCEVVEHIAAQHVGNLVATLSVGRIVAMTHATPGQPGYHHVNCQPMDYWVDLMENAGYEFLEAQTIRARAAQISDGPHWQRSGLLFRREGL